MAKKEPDRSRPIMSRQVKPIDLFDRRHRDQIRDAVWAAIIEAVRDPATGLAPLRNYEIYDALLQVQAMILASSKQAGSPTKIREIANDFAKRLRKQVAEFRIAYDRDGTPFDVLHTDEMQ
jgi:hypothetical protein